MPRNHAVNACTAVLLAALTACTDDPIAQPTVAPQLTMAEPAPGGLATVAFAGANVQLWPFTGTNFSGTPSDPINLVFLNATPRDVRAALMTVSGNRTAFGMPNAAPLNCTWKDAVGAPQTAYAEPGGWTGSAIQLECGDYAPMRFHVRLFEAGEHTIGNAHFEVLIPGTNEHEVLSWELAEQLVTIDYRRTGTLDSALPLGVSAPINPAPYRAINPLVYNGLPAALRGLIGGPLGNVGAPVPILTNGRATLFNVARVVEGERTVAVREYELPFNQVIPKPFCATGPFDYLYVTGPIQFRQQIVVTPSGNYVSHFRATGELQLTPVNPLTSPPTPIGPTYTASVKEHYKSIDTDQVTLVSSFTMRVLIDRTGPFDGSLVAHLRVGPGNADSYTLEVQCTH